MNVFMIGEKVKWQNLRGTVRGYSYKNESISYLVRWKDGHNGPDDWIPGEQLSYYVPSVVTAKR